MPTKKYIITVTNGKWEGFTVTKYSKEACDLAVDSINNLWGADCKVEEIEIYD